MVSNNAPKSERRDGGPQRAPMASPAGRSPSFGPSPMSVSRHVEDAVATSLVRDAYTRERHYFLMRLIIVMACLVVVSVVSNIYLATRPPVERYFATDTQGRIMPITPVDRPIGNNSELGVWITNSIAQAYTFSFANYRQELEAARLNFTPNGWTGFQEALKSSDTLNSVIENKYVLTAAPSGAPVLIDEGHVEGGVYAWKFQVPFVITYQSAIKATSQNLLITVVVVRQPETEQPRGLGIAQLIAGAQ
jgi:intracellular multiplication protein IcmL